MAECGANIFTPQCTSPGVDHRRSWILAILGPAVTYVLIAVSIVLSPWFSWGSNALSDLGHSATSEAAPYYNLGLLIGGFLLIGYSLLNLRLRRTFTAASLTLSALALQSVAVFDEIYGALHGLVSVAFFLLLWVTMIVYAAESRTPLTVAPIVGYMLVWVLYWAKLYGGGVAVPEAASAAFATAWLIYVVAKENLSLRYGPQSANRREEREGKWRRGVEPGKR